MQVGSASTQSTPPSVLLLLLLDLLGVFVFAIEGAMAASGGGFDLLGVLVLAFATALGGGIIRDLLIGSTPPGAIRDARYALVAFSGAVVVLGFHPFIRQLHPHVLLVLDAGGLALCAVAGAEKALVFKLSPVMAILLGAITGVGGGTIRDLLMARSPGVLHADIYAVAAMVGAGVVVLSQRWSLTPARGAWLGAISCFALRLVAVSQNWSLPKLL